MEMLGGHSAVLVPVLSRLTRRWTETIRIAQAGIRQMLATTAKALPERRPTLLRYSYLERSRMAREMEHL